MLQGHRAEWSGVERIAIFIIPITHYVCPPQHLKPIINVLVEEQTKCIVGDAKW